MASRSVARLDSSGDPSGTPNFRLDFRVSYAANADNGTSGAEGVFTAVSRSGSWYNYYYDAQSRRLRKAYPTGVADEYFYDTGHQLQEDRGNASTTPGGDYAVDEYVWLGGRPIAMVRGGFSNSWEREADGTGPCYRNNEAAACDLTYLVTDHIGKPVLALDMGRRISGVGEYDAFGRVNRQPAWGQTAHPYGEDGGAETIAWASAPGLEMTREVRVHFAYMDTQPGYGSCTTGDPTYLYDTADDSYLAGPYYGSAGDSWSDWVTPADKARVEFQWNTENINYTNYLTCEYSGTADYNGVAVDDFEYRRYQEGALPRFTPLRFPGQYYDEETDLNENWHRYYDFNTGRYLSTEPMLAPLTGLPYAELMSWPVRLPPVGGPSFVTAMSRMGLSTPTYAYALNNPVRHSDPDGLQVPALDSATSACARYPALCAALGFGAANAAKSCDVAPPAPPPEDPYQKCSNQLTSCGRCCMTKVVPVAPGQKAACISECTAAFAQCMTGLTPTGARCWPGGAHNP